VILFESSINRRRQMDRAGAIMAILVAVAAIQLRVSWRLLRSPIYEPRQKWAQLALIWLIPLLGAIVVYTMMRVEGQPPPKPEKGYTDPGPGAG
jgi:hypothetical protein